MPITKNIRLRKPNAKWRRSDIYLQMADARSETTMPKTQLGQLMNRFGRLYREGKLSLTTPAERQARLDDTIAHAKALRESITRAEKQS